MTHEAFGRLLCARYGNGLRMIQSRPGFFHALWHRT